MESTLRPRSFSGRSFSTSVAGPSPYADTLSERLAAGGNLAHHRVGHHRIVRIVCRRFADDDQAVRVRVGQRVQQHGLHYAEDGRIRAYAQGQREHGNGGEPGTAAERAQAEADVLPKRFHQGNPYHSWLASIRH